MNFFSCLGQPGTRPLAHQHRIEARCSASKACNREGKRDQRLRLHHRGGRVGRLRARQSAERGRRRARPAARGRAARSPSLHFDPARHGPHARPCHVRLGLRDRGRAQSQRPHDRGHARQGAGRLVIGQRHGLYARQSRRLRPLGAEGRSRLVLCRRAALFPARRDLGGWRRIRGAAATARSAPNMRRRPTHCSRPGSRPARRSAFRRRRTTTARRRKASAAANTPSATAGARRRRAPICGRRAGAAISTVETGAQATRVLMQRHERDRRRIRHRCGRSQAGGSKPRGDRVDRHVQCAAAADALRNRPGRASARDGYQPASPTCRSAATCRTISAPT